MNQKQSNPKNKSKSSPRTHQKFTYTQLQAFNKQSRSELRRDDRQWLKVNGYKNVGWDCAIALYEKIIDYKAKYDLEDDSLEDLFLEADRIGNKYQTSEEIETFQSSLAFAANAIADLVDKQYPDTVTEFIDYGT
jgi:hypothetical protein